MPETVKLTVNHRIDVSSSVGEVQRRILQHVTPIAKSNKLALHSGPANSTQNGIYVELVNALEPSPISPTDSAAFRTFTGAIKHVFGQEVIVAPFYGVGNTDTKVWASHQTVTLLKACDRNTGT